MSYIFNSLMEKYYNKHQGWKIRERCIYIFKMQIGLETIKFYNFNKFSMLYFERLLKFIIS